MRLLLVVLLGSFAVDASGAEWIIEWSTKQPLPHMEAHFAADGAYSITDGDGTREGRLPAELVEKVRARSVEIGFDALTDDAIKASMTRKVDLHVTDFVEATVTFRNAGKATSRSLLNVSEMAAAYPESKPLQTLKEASELVVALFSQARHR